MLDQFHEQFKTMTGAQKKAAMIITVVICIALLLAIGYGLDFLPIDFLLLSRTAKDRSQQQDMKKMTAHNAFDIALARAKEWRPDAKLSFLSTQTSSETGRSDSWRMIFASQQEKNKGFEIIIDKKAIISVQEILYHGSAADFPAHIISADEAIKRVHEIRGYTDAPILGIEAIYGSAEKSWYWGVQTSKGVVTIEAKRK